MDSFYLKICCKKLFSVLIIFFFYTFLFLFYTSKTSAAILYSNNFISSSSLDNYQEFFGHCEPSPIGLTCSSNTDEQYQLTIPNFVCISMDYTNPNVLSDQFAMTDINDFVLNKNSVTLVPYYNGHIGLYTSTTWPSVVSSSVSTPSGKHNYMLCKNGYAFTGYLDGSLVVSLTESGHNPVSFMIGSSPNVIVTNLTVTDTLPVSGYSLSVPLIKQTDPLWTAMEYDSAKKWAPLHPTIGDWGCALTSATMVMQYYGLKNMPDGTPLNPASVNKWLKNQPDGYVDGGNVNWLALSRLSKQAQSSGQNPDFGYDALEYRHDAFSSSELENDLKNNQPDILEEPGHFIVGTGENNGIFAINDPYYNRNSLSSYNNTSLSLGRYLPSHTNLSYIEIVLPTTINAVLQNATGQKEGSDGMNTFADISGANYYTQTGITDPITNTTASGAKFLIVPTPQDGNYSLTLYSTTDQPVNTKIFTYDSNGSVQTETLSGIIYHDKPKKLTFPFSQQGNSKADKLCEIFDEHIPNQQVSDFLCNLISTKL